MTSRELRPLDVLILALAIGLAAVGCAEKPDPVGRLSAGAGEVELTYPGVAEVELNWEMTAGLGDFEEPLLVFLHLLDSSGNMVRTFDHDFPATWKVGGEQSYSVPLYQSALAPPLDEGTYLLTAGLYDRGGSRWALESAGAEVAPNEYQVTRIVVVEPGSEMPQFFFSSNWLTVEGGTDLQTLGRRWLTDDGVIRLGALTVPGTLRLTLGIPEGGGALQAPVLDEGAVEQSVTVTTTCGDAAVRVSDSGGHSIELPIALSKPGEAPGSDSSDGTNSAEAGAAASSECEVSFVANYHLLSREGDERRTLALEGLSWSAGP